MVLRAKGGRRYVMNATEIAAMYDTPKGANTMTTLNTEREEIITALVASGIEDKRENTINAELQSAFMAEAIMIEDAANSLRKAIRDGDLVEIESLSRMITRKAKAIAEEASFQRHL